MKTRSTTLPSGRRMRVPENIQRIDCKATHGWQVRYAGTKLFSDGDDGPKRSLERAKAELERRVWTEAAPTRLKRGIPSHKRSTMPLGISGPVVRRRGTFLEASLLVAMPRFGRKPIRGTVYLGTENTYTAARYEAGLAKAIRMREKAEAWYRHEATAARRAST